MKRTTPDLDRALTLVATAYGRLVLGERMWRLPQFEERAGETEKCLEDALEIVRAWRKENG